MRKTFSSIRILLLLSVLSLLGGVNAAADTYTYTFTESKFKTSETAAQTVTLGDASWTLTALSYGGYDSNKDSETYKNKGQQFGSSKKTAGEITLSTESIEGTITSIKVNASTANSGKATFSVSVGGTQFGEAVTPTTTATDYTFTGSASGKVEIKINATAKAFYIKTIEIEYTASGVSVAPPTFSQESGTFEEPFTLTLATTTEGATIHYTLDGTEPTAQSTTYTTGITISATTTVKAIAVDAEGNASKVATATYTYEKVDIYDNLAALKAVAQSGTQYKVKLTNAIVTYVNGQNAYLEDGTAGILVYFKDHGLKEGNVLSGTATVTYTVYQGTNEFTAMSGYTVAEEAGTITATELTLKEILANMAKYESMRVKVVKAVAQDEQFGSDDTHRSATIKQGESEITLYNGYKTSGYDDYIQNAYIDVIGYPVEFVKSGTTLNQLKVWTDGITGYKETIKVTSAGYATHYSENAYILPEGLTAATVTAGAESGKISINYNYAAASTVPALSPVLLKGAAATYKCTIVASTEAADANTLLHGSTTDVTTSIDGEATYYKLSYDNNGENLGFYWGADNGAAFTSKGGLCYLAIPTSLSQSQLTGFAFADMEKATGIDSLPAAEPAVPHAIYTLDGRRVQTMNAKGIYIVDGQKRIVK